MSLKALIENEYLKQTADFAAGSGFQMLENGGAAPEIYNDFVINICRTHLKSPHILAFLYSVAPPGTLAENLKNNMLEELGALGETSVSHPQLLRELALAAGFDEKAQAKLEIMAQNELRRTISEPILFGTLREIGLSVMLETTAFEWMLARTAARISDFLFAFRGLSRPSLRWFHLHSEVDLKHAEEGLETIVEYVKFYEIEQADFETILEVTFRRNVFIKRYFGELALAREMQLLN